MDKGLAGKDILFIKKDKRFAQRLYLLRGKDVLPGKKDILFRQKDVRLEETNYLFRESGYLLV